MEDAKKVIVKHEEDRNEVRFNGVVIEKRSSRSHITMTLLVTSIVNGRHYSVRPSFAVFDEEAKAKTDVIPVGARVAVKGYVTSQKLTEEQKDRATALGLPSQSFVLDDIRICTDAEDLNQIMIVGTVERAYVTNTRGDHAVHYIVASIREGKYLKRIKIDAFFKEGEGADLITLMARGTKIKALCRCDTKLYDTDSGKKKTEFIVVEEIKKA